MASSINGQNGGDGAQEALRIPSLWITGIGSQYPPYRLGPEKLDEFAKRFYDVEKPGLKKLLQINRTTGIDTRASVRAYDSGFANRPDPPSIIDLDSFYRQVGVDLAAQACRKAMKEWGGSPADITHTIAVTCTNQGNPGYDLLVAGRLNLPHTVERILMHGVGCAGGLAIMRVAAQIACGTAVRDKPARILAFACELCTPNVRHDLAEAEACADPANINIAGVLFSDAAAAFVLCNEQGMLHDLEEREPPFQLLEWENSTIPSTMEHMSFYADPTGFRTVLTRDVPGLIKKAIGPAFQKLLPSFQAQTGLERVGIPEFDWALHPGGQAIIIGAQEELGLTDDQLRATRQVYKTRGNSASPTVLVILDLLRNMGRGRDHVVATSFGPGLVVEMALLKRCRGDSVDT
ncbi:hypothetical protein DL765_005747 [Monosporascus sp. GIB2]|nr:hypothetical protein DL765_005747 [Monosporascus sp. GIB2]